MLKHNLFGVFLKEKRQEENISLRELSYKANIGHTYIAKIENGSKPPPSDDVLLRLAKGLCLDDESFEIFFDLAAKCKRINDDKNFYLPADISKYLSNEDNAKSFIRKASKLGNSNEFWNELLKQLEK
ncbi:MAG: transcriptional regulator [Eubacterium coprostanoligenes]|nr:transcriptional regulator [Eubacterium coprostanoligenes]MDY5399804.1 transcriptional regulator [Eubacterium coprostanoligenes]